MSRTGRDKLRELVEPGDTEQLVRVYQQAGRNENDRDIRIEALIEIAEADPAAAEPLLRKVIEGPDDPWVVMAALDTARRNTMAGLLDAAEAALQDPRPIVAETAKLVHKRLRKAARRGHP